jgi:pyruvate dehydrogenase E1 component alpha subunit
MHESMNLASIWGLPLIFVCENNGVSQATPLDYYSSVTTLSDRAAAYRMAGVTVDGMDAFAVHEAAGEAVARARSGAPTFLEAVTWRYRGHFEGDQMTYRLREQDEAFRRRDPIEGFRRRALAEGLLDDSELAALDARADEEVDDAVEFARAGAAPSPHECLEDVYVSYPSAHLAAGPAR